MSYPQKVPEGWRKGEAVRSYGNGPRYAIERDIPPGHKWSPEQMATEFAITFDSWADCAAWLNWWNKP